MKAYLLPDVLLARAVVRLRAMADAIEAGKGLNDVAELFRIPVDALRIVVSPKLRKPPIHKIPAISRSTLARAAVLLRGGASYREIANELKVKRTTLAKALMRAGLTANIIHKAHRESREAHKAHAVELYRQGIRIADISRQTGVSVATLYKCLRKDSDILRRPHRAASQIIPRSPSE